jgi:hypothetical protein
MVHFLASDEKYRDLIYDDDDRSYPATGSRSMSDYRFGRTQGKPARARTRNAVRHISGHLKNMIEMIANVKLRRLERGLELRAVRSDRSNRVTRESRPTGHSR